MSKRLEEILNKNAELEKESPYNFCDRWCERCAHEEQVRCALYKDELERKITCIAHGKDEDNLEMTKQILEAQYGKVDEILGEQMDRYGIDPDNPDIDRDEDEEVVDFDGLPQNIQEHIKFVKSSPLPATAEQYCKRAYDFLKGTFYKDKKRYAALNYDFQTVAWYHTLLVVKLQRALTGFHQPAPEDGFVLYDAVAQFEICEKAIKLSVEALRKIHKDLVSFHQQILELIALLHNIYSRIEAMEESI